MYKRTEDQMLLRWYNSNELTTLIKSLENYHQGFGWYPETVLADKAQRSRDNLRYCKNMLYD
jgi:IS5 family transposase